MALWLKFSESNSVNLPMMGSIWVKELCWAERVRRLVQRPRELKEEREEVRGGKGKRGKGGEERKRGLEGRLGVPFEVFAFAVIENKSNKGRKTRRNN